MKTIITIIFIIIFSSCLIFLSSSLNKTVLAANGNSTSDLQLVARAINGEARGEPYEGQVAVRCCDNE